MSMYSLMYSILRAGPCIRWCILYSGKVHVFADVFCTQGRSMYLLRYSVLRTGPCISWCVLYSGQFFVLADAVYTQGKSMYSEMYSIHRAVLCISWCILYSGQAHVFANLVHIEGRTMYSLMQSVLRAGSVYSLTYSVHVLRAGPCIRWCRHYTAQVQGHSPRMPCMRPTSFIRFFIKMFTKIIFWKRNNFKVW